MANGFQFKPPLQHLPPRSDESFRVTEYRERAPGCSWHHHPEYQLSLILQGTGQRIVGGNLRPIQPNEVTLLGPNLPHVWNYEEGCQIHVIVVHFTRQFAGTDFLERPEARPLRLLLAQSSGGLEIQGHAKEEAASALQKMVQERGLSRMVCLLRALNSIANSPERTILSESAERRLAELDLERLRCVYSYVDARLHEPISREEVASLTHLSPSAFSRFFRQHTGTTFQGYLNDRRIGRACDLLPNLSLTISEIALDCGFATPASFTRAFRRARGMSPSDYRNRLNSVLANQRRD